jgi:RNA polymerase sigma-70 factor (ECF subfamily)
MTEEQIIEGCLESTGKAQAALYKRWRRYLFAVALSVLKNNQDAEDVLQESFLKVFKNLHTFTDGKSFKAWMAAIVKNTALSHLLLNKKYNRYEMLDDYEPLQKTVPYFLDAFIARDEYNKAKVILHNMAPGQYMYTRLYFEEEMDYDEISKDLEVPVGTVKSQVSRGAAKLRQIIYEFGNVKQEYKATT